MLCLRPSDSDVLLTLSDAFPGGVSVQLEAGEYVFERPILLPSNTVIAGVGNQTKLILAEDSNCHLLTNAAAAGGNENVVLRRMSIFGNRSNQRRPENHHGLTYSCAVYLRRVKGALIEDVTFDEIAQTAIHFNGSSELVVRRIRAQGMGWSGLGTSGASNLWIEDVVVMRAGLESTHSGIHLDGGMGNSIIGAHVSEASGNGIMLDSAYAPLSHCQVNATVVGCFRGLSLSGQAHTPVELVIVSGEYARNSEAGIMISNSRGVVLSGCKVHHNQNYGVLIQGKAGGRECMISTDCRLEANGKDVAELHASGKNWIFRDPSELAPELAKVNVGTLRSAALRGG